MKTMSIKIDEKMFADIKNISNIFNISNSEFIRIAVEKEIELRKKDFMVRMCEVNYCDEEEEKEILDALSNLKDEDLEIVERKKIKL